MAAWMFPAAHMRADAHSRAMADERARRRTIEAEAESSAEAIKPRCGSTASGAS